MLCCLAGAYAPWFTVVVFVVVCWHGQRVGALNRGCAKKIQKTTSSRNHSSGNITRQPDNYSNYFLVFLTFAGPMPRVVQYLEKSNFK